MENWAPSGMGDWLNTTAEYRRRAEFNTPSLLPRASIPSSTHINRVPFFLQEKFLGELRWTDRPIIEISVKIASLKAHTRVALLFFSYLLHPSFVSFSSFLDSIFSFSLLVYPSICLFVCQSVCLSVCLSLYNFVQPTAIKTSWVMCCIKLATSIRLSFVLHFVSEPSGPPTKVRAMGTNISSISVFWQQPSLITRNGVIIKYTLYWRKANSSTPFEKIDLTSTHDQVGIFDLAGNTKYVVSLSAWTSFGEGPASASLTAITGRGRKSTTQVHHRSNVNGLSALSYFGFWKRMKIMLARMHTSIHLLTKNLHVVSAVPVE